MKLDTGNILADHENRLSFLENQSCPPLEPYVPIGKVVPGRVSYDNYEIKQMIASQQEQIDKIKAEVNYLMNKLNKRIGKNKSAF